VECPRKIRSPREAEAIHRSARAAGERVVLCHGCFDIVHPGHIRHLQHAARLGDRLVVSITGDSLVDKGTGRPLIPQELRAENLAALDCVDWVVINQDPTAVGLIELLRPDVYVKGREYEDNGDPRFQAERESVERYGGRLVFTSGDVVFSSTALISALETSAHPVQARISQLLAQHRLLPEAIEATIDSFRGTRVVVVGETIIDTYVMCDRPDVAGEGPIMSLRPVEYRHFDGGAAIIAAHAAAMGARPILVTALPRTPASEALRRRLALQGVEVRALDVDRPLIEKQRFLVGACKVVKLDLGDPITLDASERNRLVEIAAAAAEGCDAAVVADFGLGLQSPAGLGALCTMIRQRVGVMVGDVSGRRSSLLEMRDMDLLCPTEVEMREALHDFQDGLSDVTWRLLAATKSRAALVTMGDQGVTAFGPGTDRLWAEHVPALSPFAIDPLGCGDAMLAAAALTLAANRTLLLAALLGSVAAAAQAQKLGNAVIGASDLRRGLRRLVQAQLTWDAEPSSRIVSTRRDHLSAANA
jgi:rfaE bifunctional protein nucleotidyltransferase chain/domain